MSEKKHEGREVNVMKIRTKPTCESKVQTSDRILMFTDGLLIIIIIIIIIILIDYKEPHEFIMITSQEKVLVF